MRSRMKIDIPSFADFPNYTTWTEFNATTSPLQIFPEGNSIASTYENVDGRHRLQSPHRALVEPNGLSAITSGTIRLPRREQRSEPIDRELLLRPDLQPTLRRSSGGEIRSMFRAVISRRRTTALRVLCHSGTRRSLFRLSKRRRRDGHWRYPLQTFLGWARRIRHTFSYVSGQMSTAGLAAFPMGLGDINGDGTGMVPLPMQRTSATS